MQEVANGRKHHSDVVSVCNFYSLCILDGAPRLNDCSDSRCCRGFRAIGKWEEGVRGHDCALLCFTCLFDSKSHGPNAIHLPCADSYDLSVFRKDNRIALNMAHHAPGKKHLL